MADTRLIWHGFAAFLLYYHLRGLSCPCGADAAKLFDIPCRRVEIAGTQPFNLLMIPIGYYFSRWQQLVVIALLHFLWEAYEKYVLSPNTEMFGGCVDDSGKPDFWLVTTNDLVGRPLLLALGASVKYLVTHTS